MKVNHASITIDPTDRIEVLGRVADRKEVGVRLVNPTGNGLLWVDGLRGPQWLRQLADAIELSVADSRVSDSTDAANIARVNDSPVPARLVADIAG